MARKQEIDFELPKLDDLFTTQQERDEAKLKKIHDIPLDQIDDFPSIRIKRSAASGMERMTLMHLRTS